MNGCSTAKVNRSAQEALVGLRFKAAIFNILNFREMRQPSLAVCLLFDRGREKNMQIL